MAKSYLFYDLEPSGLDTRTDRIMQFAAIRTDMDFNQVGEPVNMFVRLNDDTLPSPDAVMVSGITPQKTVEEGYSEAEFDHKLVNDIFIPDTIIVGFNNIRFDDEFIRHLFWRNFYDPYEWSYKEGRSRWDILDLCRMTRALRPEGINWPVDDEGVATNRLELIGRANGIDHIRAHDALSDVGALIGVTELLHEKQPQIFDYLFRMRDKNEVKKLVNLDNKQPFVYSSGRYDSDYNKTTVAFPLAAGRNGNVVVYDLRYDPTPFLNMSSKELANKLFASWEERKSEDFVKLPVKELQYNRAPAVAPMGVLEQSDGWAKIQLDQDMIAKNQKTLLSNPGFAENLRTLYQNREEYKGLPDPEAKLYDGFLPDGDRMRVEVVRSADENELADMHPSFTDERLNPLLLHYKARNYPKSLSRDEAEAWEKWRANRLESSLAAFIEALSRLSKTNDENKLFILQELQLWAESIIPADTD
jgi:exodeoxyribonuclease-1